MNPNCPRLSIIVAAPPGQELISSMESLKGLDLPKGFAELIITRGRMPSIQRNVAVKEASGEWLYFLDDDSMLSVQAWKRVKHWVEEADAEVVGGPNLCPEDASFVQSIFAVLLGSALTFGPSRARYMSNGKIRASTEKELILCNLLIRKSAFEKAGGFDEALYPNEENALMESIAQEGGRLFYDPALSVMRYPRSKLGSFLHMLFRYGCGRAQQFRRHPSAGSLLNMAPALFLVYILLSVGLLMLRVVKVESVPAMVLLIPFLLYGLALLGQMMRNLGVFGVTRSLLAMPMMLLCHLSYGAGFWVGCLKNGDMSSSSYKASEVVIEKVNMMSPHT
jgi:succinoglycan biosynthesis protein ExoA